MAMNLALCQRARRKYLRQRVEYTNSALLLCDLIDKRIESEDRIERKRLYFAIKQAAIELQIKRSGFLTTQELINRFELEASATSVFNMLHFYSYVGEL